jgi:protoheme IX farnesyltransferase
VTGIATVQALARLFRLRLSLFVALSAATGHAAAAYRLGWEILLPSLACVLLAAGSSALNQWQERDRDGQMSRTRNRPIPTGVIAPNQALAVAFALIVVAIALLAACCGAWATLFGISAVVLYNGLYTWMKRWTAFAAVPGAVIGALGPAIGWVAAGGAPQSPALLAIAMVFFLWQVPHFWLLSLNYPADYRDAGYPNVVERMGGDRLYRVGLIWIACTAVATLSLPLFGLLNSGVLYLVLCGFAALLGGVLLRTVRRPIRYRVGFTSVNMFVLATMILLIVESGL